MDCLRTCPGFACAESGSSKWSGGDGLEYLAGAARSNDKSAGKFNDKSNDCRDNLAFNAGSAGFNAVGFDANDLRASGDAASGRAAECARSSGRRWQQPA